MSKVINVGIVGTQFMGRAHSNAYLDVAHYFDRPAPTGPARGLRQCGREPVSLPEPLRLAGDRNVVGTDGPAR